jgi:hypothetical protein
MEVDVVKELVRKFGRMLRDQGGADCVPAVTLTDQDHVTYCLTHGQPIHLCPAENRSVDRYLEAGLQVQRTRRAHCSNQIQSNDSKIQEAARE